MFVIACAELTVRAHNLAWRTIPTFIKPATRCMNSTIPLSFTALMQRMHPGLLRNLAPDPEQARHMPNKTARQVKSGHYVEVHPTPLPTPRYVIHSPAFFEALGLADAVGSDPAFMQFFTGDLDSGVEAANAAGVSPTVRPSGWATGYALSIYGQEMVNNCPFRTGNGYGDGRAIWGRFVFHVVIGDLDSSTGVGVAIGDR